MLAEVICALLSACYLIWGQLAPLRGTGVAPAGAEKLCLGHPRWSLALSVLGVPGTGHCLGQDQAPGSCQKHPPPGTGKGHRWDPWVFQRRRSEAEGTTEKRHGR